MNRRNLICWLLLLLPSAILFGPALARDQTLAYRDSGRFYYRQFEWNQAQWKKGEIPLWNSQENLGAPVVAEASSSVFYPGQVLFLLPGLKFSAAFVIYAALHVYLANLGTFLLARAIGCRRSSALLAAYAYSFSGSLVFQSCNIVFLVGGGWLPLCLWMSLRLTRSPGISSAAWLGFFVAMTVLGGDPQTAYHVGILSAILLVGQYFGTRDKAEKDKCKQAITGHALAAVFAFGLAAIQILPSWDATRKSTRSYSEYSRTVWEMLSGKKAKGLFGHPQPGTHHDHLYQFSQTPWSFAELIWPNNGGELVGPNGRWTESIPAAGRSWNSSIYCGLLTIALALSGLARRSKRLRDRWIKTSFFLFALGSLGWYGVGWLIHEIQNGVLGANPADSPVGAPVGGVYWFFVVFLPGYVSFRYPAKLFLVATLFLCLVAGRELQTLSRQQNLVRLRRSTLLIFGLTLLAMLAAWISAIPINNWFQRVTFRDASEFGPFDPTAAWSSIIGSLIHTLVLSIAVLTLINQRPGKRWLMPCFLVITLVDLFLANRHLVITARSSLWNRPQEIISALDQQDDSLVRVYRTNPMIWSTKTEWLSKAEDNRLEQIVHYEVQTLMSRHHLGRKLGEPVIGLVESFRSIEDAEFASLMTWLDSLPGIRTNDSYDVHLAPNPVALGLLGCRYLLIPRWGSPQVPNQDAVKEIESMEALLIRNPYCVPRFHVVYEIEPIEPIENLIFWLKDVEHQKFVQAKTRYGHPDNPDLVEVKETFKWTSDSKSSPTAKAQVNVVKESNTEIELEIEGDLGLLIIAEQYDEDWQAYWIDEDGGRKQVPILRANLISRGVPLVDPSSEEKETYRRVRLVYRPRWVNRGSWISGLTLIGFCAIFVGQIWRTRRP